VRSARLAARAGEDSRAILAEAGLSAEEIDALLASGAVRG
jgi:crotonobetainyl-CoA:carnitine CoA-transferase CaiB-like acyl-CoA transferase